MSAYFPGGQPAPATAEERALSLPRAIAELLAAERAA